MSAKRNLRGHLREYGYDDLPGLEVIATNDRLISFYDLFARAKGDKPTVFFRENNAEWLVCMKMDDFMELYRSWEIDTKETRDLPFT